MDIATFASRRYRCGTAVYGIECLCGAAQLSIFTCFYAFQMGSASAFGAGRQIFDPVLHAVTCVYVGALANVETVVLTRRFAVLGSKPTWGCGERARTNAHVQEWKPYK